MNFQELYKKIYELDRPMAEEPNEGNYFGNQVRLAKMRGDKEADLDGDGELEPVKEMGCGSVGPSPMEQQDNVSMNVTMNGSGKGGIRDLMNILRNIEQGSDSEDELGTLIGKMKDPEHDREPDLKFGKKLIVGDEEPVEEYANEPNETDLPLPMSGTDIHKPHGNYAATQPGDNPMAVIRENLKNLYKKYQ